MPDAPGLELIAGELRDAYPGSVLGTYHEHGQACLIVDPEQVLAVLAWLRDTPGQQYRFLASVHGVDYLPAEPRFGVHYELLNRDRVERIRVRAALADPAATGNGRPSADPPANVEVPPVQGALASGDPGEARITAPPGAAGSAEGWSSLLPSIDSCVGLFPTADFQEREVYDFFGIVFRGHPDMRRILMPEGYVGWPQRRDFPLGGEPVIFTYNEREAPGWSE
jgi:NADH-quinone oxidoreductase subunit C